MWNSHEKYIRLIIIILFVSLYIIYNYIIKIKVNNLIYSGKIEIKNARDFINKLNQFAIYRQPKYILLFDYINLFIIKINLYKYNKIIFFIIIQMKDL